VSLTALFDVSVRHRRSVRAFVLSALLLCGLGVVDSSSAQSTGADQAIRRFRALVARNPYDARAYYGLGDAYIQKARERGDVTYFNLAEQALRKALELRPGYGDALRHLAFVLYTRHDFAGAAAEAQKAIELTPADGHAYGILGDAYLEIGKYDEAERAYHRMMERDRSLYSLGRLAGLKSVRGDPQGAIQELERAIEAGKASARPAESVAWVEWQLGAEYFAIGNLKSAEASFAAALKTYPSYYRALAGLAQVRVAQQRSMDAVDLYRKAIAIIPLPEYAAALGDVYATIGKADEAKKQYDLVEYIGQLNEINQVMYNRELAYFYADHDIKLDRALELARKELEVRRDIYAHDVLAWALLKNGHADEALQPMDEALKFGTKDAKLYFHAGLIHHRLGNDAKAKEYLERALQTNRHFHVLHAATARRVLDELAKAR
jgi:pentatricopeptide repeat protein